MRACVCVVCVFVCVCWQARQARQCVMEQGIDGYDVPGGLLSQLKVTSVGSGGARQQQSASKRGDKGQQVHVYLHAVHLDRR